MTPEQIRLLEQRSGIRIPKIGDEWTTLGIMHAKELAERNAMPRAVQPTPMVDTSVPRFDMPHKQPRPVPDGQWHPAYEEPSPEVPYNDEELQRQYGKRMEQQIQSKRVPETDGTINLKKSPPLRKTPMLQTREKVDMSNIQPRSVPTVWDGTPYEGNRWKPDFSLNEYNLPRGLFGARDEQGNKTHRGLLGGISGWAKDFFNDPSRLALTQAGLTAMDSDSYYDKEGYSTGLGGALNKALAAGVNTYQTALTRPLRYGQNSMGQIFDKQTGKVINRGLGAAGGFMGTAEFAQNRNILLNPNADISSPQYRAAYFGEMQRQTKSFIDPTTNQVTFIRPNMSAYRPPLGYTGDIQGQNRKRTKPYPDAQMQSAGFYDRMLDATATLENVYAGIDGIAGTEDDLTPKEVFGNKDLALSKYLGDVGNMMVTSEFQMALQAMRNWVTANLRKESGAAIPPEEQAQEFVKWFPSIGDSPEVIEQKREARKVAERGMRAASQGAWNAHFKPQYEVEKKGGGKQKGSTGKQPDWVIGADGRLKRNRRKK